MLTFAEVCEKNNLIIHDDAGNELPFRQVIKQIYYDWDRDTLQDFMNALMLQECSRGEGQGERFFND